MMQVVPTKNMPLCICKYILFSLHLNKLHDHSCGYFSSLFLVVDQSNSVGGTGTFFPNFSVNEFPFLFYFVLVNNGDYHFLC